MANEVISLANLQRFKGKCDSFYSGKLYWHTITLGFNDQNSLTFSVKLTEPSALTKAKLKALNNKYISGYFYNDNDGYVYPLEYMTVDVISRVAIYYYDPNTRSTKNTSTYSSPNYTITDVVEAL